jgi:hypothetical protein
MIFFRRKKPSSSSTPAAPVKKTAEAQVPKTKSFQSIIYPRVLTAEGWRRQQLGKKNLSTYK